MGRQMDAGKAAGMSHPYVNTLYSHPSKTSLKATTAWPSCHSRGPRAEHRHWAGLQMNLEPGPSAQPPARPRCSLWLGALAVLY